MKLDDSNKRYSYFIAGILVIAVASIFLACVFGIWDHKIISWDNPLSDRMVIPVNNGNNIMRNNEIIIPSGVGFPPTHEKVSRKFDTEEGWLYFTQTPGIIEPLPLTITQDVVDSWGDIIVYSFGGYGFVNGGADLYQKDDGWIGSITYNELSVLTDQELTVDLDGDGPLDEQTYVVDVYTLDVVLDQPQIVLESNHLPDLYDTGCMWAFDCPPVPDLNKDVRFKENMKWEGCYQNDQQFRVMLAYKCMLRSPELPIKKFIASFKQ
ncbi:MAG: hypothetical protein ACFFDH_25300 [Promethearchaeota archaeon]